MDKSIEHKIGCYFNMAAHYNSLLYRKMDEQLGCDFVFGEKIDDIKEMDTSLLKGYRYTARRKFHLHNLFWTEEDAFDYMVKHNYDVIIINPVTRCLTSWKVILWAHRHGKKVFYYGHGYYGKEGWLQSIIKKIVFSWCDGFFLYGDYAKNLMVEKNILPSSKLYPIYNSMDYDKQLSLRKKLVPEPLYKSHFGNEYKNIFYVGRLTKVKKLEMLIKAVAELARQGHDYNLTFIGGGEEEPVLREMAMSLGLKNVWFYGPCYEEKLLGQLIYNADLCVAPGNIGLTAMHVMMYGTPAISHNNFKYQMPEFEAIEEGKTGSFFEQDSLPSLCQTIQSWFAIHKEREEIRRDCYHVMDTKYNTNVQIEIIKKAISDVYDKSN